MWTRRQHINGLKKYFERSDWQSCHCSYHIEIHVSCSCKSIFPCLSANLFISLVHIISKLGLHPCIKVDFNSLSSIISKSPAMSSDNCTLNPDGSKRPRTLISMTLNLMRDHCPVSKIYLFLRFHSQCYHYRIQEWGPARTVSDSFPGRAYSEGRWKVPDETHLEAMTVTNTTKQNYSSRNFEWQQKAQSYWRHDSSVIKEVEEWWR